MCQQLVDVPVILETPGKVRKGRGGGRKNEGMRECRGWLQPRDPNGGRAVDAHRPRSFTASSKRLSFIAVVTSLVCREQRWTGLH